MKRNSNLFFVFLLFIGCQPADLQLEMAQEFLPSEALLKQGVVNKYYFHFASHDDYEKTTDVGYTLLKVEKPGQLIWENYDAAMQLTRGRLFELKGSEMHMIRETVVMRGDTSYSTIKKPIIVDWATGESEFEKEIKMPRGLNQWEIQGVGFKDTSVMNLPARIYYKDFKTVFRNYKDTVERAFLLKDLVVQGYGPFSYEYDNLSLIHI